MARNHHYRYLFGTVSISRDYTNLSRDVYKRQVRYSPVMRGFILPMA